MRSIRLLRPYAFSSNLIRYGSPAARSESPRAAVFPRPPPVGRFVSGTCRESRMAMVLGIFRSFSSSRSISTGARRQPRTCYFSKAKDRHSYQQICAHEFGHILGLGDAYGANYRFFYEAPCTGNYMMCHNRTVQPEELEMVLRAHLTNRMQYFPKNSRKASTFRGFAGRFNSSSLASAKTFRSTADDF